MSLWTDDTINSIAAEAELEVATQLNCITKRLSLKINPRTSIYNVPDDVISIRRMTWLGKKLEPLAFRGILKYPIISPAGTVGAFDISSFSTAFNVGGSDSTPASGTPYNYFYSGFGENIVKIFPTPAVSVAKLTTDLFGANIANGVIVEYYTFPDVTGNTYRLPQYIARRIIKSFSLSRLLTLEGPGQDLVGAMRHRARFTNLMEDFRKINSGVFVSRMRTRTPGANSFATKISRPRLPTNFGTFAED